MLKAAVMMRKEDKKKYTQARLASLFGVAQNTIFGGPFAPCSAVSLLLIGWWPSYRRDWRGTGAANWG